jgi:hypothetical protein
MGSVQLRRWPLATATNEKMKKKKMKNEIRTFPGGHASILSLISMTSLVASTISYPFVLDRDSLPFSREIVKGSKDKQQIAISPIHRYLAHTRSFGSSLS